MRKTFVHYSVKAKGGGGLGRLKAFAEYPLRMQVFLDGSPKGGGDVRFQLSTDTLFKFGQA